MREVDYFQLINQRWVLNRDIADGLGVVEVFVVVVEDFVGRLEG